MKKHICDFLRLDSFDITIFFQESRSGIINLFCENNILVEKQTEKEIIVISKLFSLDVDFYISFQFLSDKLIAVAISPSNTLEGKTLILRYNKIQKALENELGRSKKRLMSIMNLIDSENRLSYWHNRGVMVKHYLFNRFGTEEIISIEFPN